MRRSMEVAAYRFGRRMIWSRVAREYDAIYRAAARQRAIGVVTPLRAPAAERVRALARAASPGLLEAAD
jgi:hypothetical protein